MVMNSPQDAAITAAETARLVRQLADIEAIRQLKNRYCELCDADYDADALAGLFTDDAVWDGGPMGAHHGREAIRRFFEGSSTRVAFALHMVLNPQIEVDGDVARARWYLWQPMVYRLPGGEQAWWMSARYDDRCVRTDQGWRFARVQVALKILAPCDRGWGDARVHDVYGTFRGPST